MKKDWTIAPATLIVLTIRKINSSLGGLHFFYSLLDVSHLSVL